MLLLYYIHLTTANTIRLSAAGILEQHWNGTKLETVDTMLERAKSMTWKGIQPVVNLSKTAYQKGISLSKVAMQAIEAKLERNPILPK